MSCQYFFIIGEIFMSTLGERLKALRMSKQIRQVEMAELLGVSDRHYQRIEHNQVNISYLVLITLADFFDVSLDYLVGRSDNPERR